MTCKCTNFDGTLSDICYGTCKKESIIKQEEDARRDPLNGFAELILSQVEKIIQNRMTSLQITFQKDQFELSKKSYREGILDGIEIGIKQFS